MACGNAAILKYCKADIILKILTERMCIFEKSEAVWWISEPIGLLSKLSLTSVVLHVACRNFFSYLFIVAFRMCLVIFTYLLFSRVLVLIYRMSNVSRKLYMHVHIYMYKYEDINIYSNLSVVWFSYFWQVYWLRLLQVLFCYWRLTPTIKRERWML